MALNISDNLLSCRYAKWTLTILLCQSLAIVCAQTNVGTQRPKMDSVTHKLQEVVVTTNQILGSKFQAQNRTGSAYYLSPQEIVKFGYTDINRMLKAVPGVNLYEEDGYGLRPNISLRGTQAERSERIVIMEDGILASPAPYSAPAAYYFPNAARMYAVEVLKGSSQVQYGPFTTGGAINLVSTPIPNHFSGKAQLSYGSFNTLKAHAHVGDRWKHFGYMVEYLRYQSDGFKKSTAGKPFGFWRNDLIAKVILNTAKEEGMNHSLELKFGYANEKSDESYVGLSETDFQNTPFMRYPGADKDNMRTNHQQYVATYLMNLGTKWQLTANLYYNRFHRNWYKLNDVRASEEKQDKAGIAQILEAPETNRRFMDILIGKTDRYSQALIVKANNRTYHSRGFQVKAKYRFNIGEHYINTEAGLRLHKDDEDRFQWNDAYAMKQGAMELYLPGIHGTDANRITEAEATAAYGLVKWAYHKWTVTAGMRYEQVNLLNKDYTTADLLRTGHLRQEIKNSAKAFIPGLGIHWQVLDPLSLFIGVHKGFAPPSATLGQKAESSINTEIGTRYNTRNLAIELIGFYNRYDNMLGSDLAASGGTGSLIQFNVGKADVRGLEFLVRWQPLPAAWKVRLPLQLSYTYTDTEMKSRFSSSAWGEVFEGDEIPYINKHTLNGQVGAEYKQLTFNVGIHYTSDMRTTPGQGNIAKFNKVPARLIFDAAANYRFNKQITFTVNAVNLTNKHYIASRHPSGLRPGHPFGIYGGVKFIW